MPDVVTNNGMKYAYAAISDLLMNMRAQLDNRAYDRGLYNVVLLSARSSMLYIALLYRLLYYIYIIYYILYIMYYILYIIYYVLYIIYYILYIISINDKLMIIYYIHIYHLMILWTKYTDNSTIS